MIPEAHWNWVRAQTPHSFRSGQFVIVKQYRAFCIYRYINKSIIIIIMISIKLGKKNEL